MFKSEKVIDNLKMPAWKETFTFTLEDGKEVLMFDIIRHNSSEGDFSIDQFEILLAEHIETLKD